MYHFSGDIDCGGINPYTKRSVFKSYKPIPHICHFLYTDRIFENQILHPKKRLKAPKTLKMSLKKSNICIFFTQSGKIYTWQKFFTQAPPVVPVTNMRYDILPNKFRNQISYVECGKWVLWSPLLSINHAQFENSVHLRYFQESNILIGVWQVVSFTNCSSC